MNKYSYKGEIITASSKEEAITKIIAGKQPKMEKVVAKDKEHLKKLIEDAMDKYGDKCDLNFIDVSNITDMSYLFYGKKVVYFNGNISKWNVSRVTNMEGMFLYSHFNGDISKWDVSNVKNMCKMFKLSDFNGNISKWNVSRVTNMEGMFAISKFNKDISKWSIGKHTNVYEMFHLSKFNKDISKWKINKTRFNEPPKLKKDKNESDFEKLYTKIYKELKKEYSLLSYGVDESNEKYYSQFIFATSWDIEIELKYFPKGKGNKLDIVVHGKHGYDESSFKLDRFDLKKVIKVIKKYVDDARRDYEEGRD